MTTTGTISTSPDSESDTILFVGEDTPAEAYEVVTDAVYSAKFQDGWVQIDIENIPPHTAIGAATYEDGEVTNLDIDNTILEEYGYEE